MIRYLIFRLLTVFVPFVSFSIIDIFSEITGSLIYFSGNWRVDTMQNNLAAINAENGNVRRTFVNMIANYCDFIRFYYVKRTVLGKITQIEPPNVPGTDERFILLTGHFGNWELAGLFITYLGYQMVTVAESKGPGERMYQLFVNMRSRENLKVLRLEDPAIGQLFKKSIDEGLNPVLLLDRDITKTGVSVQMGNKKALIPKGPYFFTKRHSLPMQLGVFFRIKHKKYRYTSSIVPIDTVFKMKKDAQQAINSFIEVIKLNPYEWFAFDINWEA